jgi:hypothetical protein
MMSFTATYEYDVPLSYHLEWVMGLYMLKNLILADRNGSSGTEWSTWMFFECHFANRWKRFGGDTFSYLVVRPLRNLVVGIRTPY